MFNDRLWEADLVSRTVAVWLALAGLAGGWGVMEIGAGAGALLPGLLTVVALGCAVDAGLSDRVMAGVLRAFSASSLRVVVIVIGAAFLWQLVGVELALLMAGDVIAYLEVVTAVTLVAANSRWGPIRAGIVERLGEVRRMVVIRIGRLPRPGRAVRPRRRPSAPGRDEDPAGAFALA